LNEPSITARYIGFSLIPGIGRARLSLLESYFGNLAMMELKGMIKQTGGMNYALSR
jgi:hypothetical protein